MYLQSEIIKDTTQLSLAENKYKTWESIYDRYAPLIYGIIYRLTGAEVIAENILIKCFFHLKEKQIISTDQPVILPSVLRSTYRFTLQQLNNNPSFQ